MNHSSKVLNNSEGNSAVEGTKLGPEYYMVRLGAIYFESRKIRKEIFRGLLNLLCFCKLANITNIR
jgi:hypothetical protein